MSPSISQSPRKRRPTLTLAIFAIAAFCLVMASRGLLEGYSYWSDELFSVSASQETWKDLYANWLLVDVHPPLYQVLLKFWIERFGGSEIATRLLSFIFAIGTLIIFTTEAYQSREPRRALALALMGLSPAFVFYSQETRSYSMALMLASLVTVLALRLGRTSEKANGSGSHVGCSKAINFLYYSAAIALSLTHYFGWIYVFSLSVVNFFERSVEPRRWKTILLVVLMSLWPAWHLLAGNLVGKTGGDFWIGRPTPVIGTINNYLKGCLPFLSLGESPYTFLSSWVLLLSLTLIAFGSFKRVRRFVFRPDSLGVEIPAESRFLFILLLVMISLNSLIDVHTPMSTPRNFIVLLPATVLLLSNSLHSLARGGHDSQVLMYKYVAILLSFFLAALLFVASYRDLSRRIAPMQNWKALAAYVKDSRACSEGCFAIGSFGLHTFYFDTQEFAALQDLSLSASSILSGEGDLAATSLNERLASEVEMTLGDPGIPVLGFHVASQVAKELTQSRVDALCLQPPQSGRNSTFIVLPNKTMLSGSEKEFGMKPCQF